MNSSPVNAGSACCIGNAEALPALITLPVVIGQPANYIRQELVRSHGVIGHAGGLRFSPDALPPSPKLRMIGMTEAYVVALERAMWENR
jgi:hypothetical protein